MTGFSHDIQMAIFDALDNNAALTSLLASHNRAPRSAIYGRMPQPDDSGDNSLFPIITMGEDSVQVWATDTATGADAQVELHIWSRYPGWKEAKEVSGAVFDALHRKDITVPNHELLGIEWQDDEMIRDSDGLTMHLVTTYRVLIDEAGYGE